ncbi:hypothetical protein RBH29_16480 [Herbivorax sp. ANBcel31]|uniref:hypothetical protein n=1 Tax=Herbivorax sp. ANBcel31 TaxID=3069754 RepID=UPI0027AFB7C1|nr:hypothetical protein [Herbivorax sp. ANBcel31]MDQ2088026.1 hypothetical protein [Herbivorax sp. ANBcel31]
MNIFIAGPRAISRLDKLVIHKINDIMDNNYNILVGDANGVDKAVQKFCSEKSYKNVRVCATMGKARNNLGS